MNKNKVKSSRKLSLSEPYKESQYVVFIDRKQMHIIISHIFFSAGQTLPKHVLVLLFCMKTTFCFSFWDLLLSLPRPLYHVQDLLVLGAGPIGLLALQVAKASGRPYAMLRNVTQVCVACHERQSLCWHVSLYVTQGTSAWVSCRHV